MTNETYEDLIRLGRQICGMEKEGERMAKPFRVKVNNRLMIVNMNEVEQARIDLQRMRAALTILKFEPAITQDPALLDKVLWGLGKIE